MMLVDLKNKIQSEIDNGKTLEEVLVNESITKEYKFYSGCINENKIKTSIYKSLSNN
jgi:hypothetical protein